MARQFGHLRKLKSGRWQASYIGPGGRRRTAPRTFRTKTERTVASPAEVVALVEAITPRHRAAVLLAAWCGLRRGEVLGLFREDVDVQQGTVTVRRN
ncbi:MAG TPA: hypothetical protein VFI47_12635, partial [Acidimicrobiales bacterium]|nr:hypothetical protein [Acidimicrobiales bacterium]